VKIIVDSTKTVHYNLHMTLMVVRNRLRELTAKPSSIRKWSDENGEHFSFIAAIIRGEVKRPPERILKKIKVRMKLAEYERIPDYRN